MSAADIATIAAVAIAGLGLISTAIMVYFTGRQIKLERKMTSLDFTTGQFDKLTDIGARAEFRALGDKDILEYTNYGKKDENKGKIRNLLEYAYAFNRIGAGINKKALSEDIVFNIWTPGWIMENWRRLEPLITKEREQPGLQEKRGYLFFEWLATVRCPEVKNKYPELDLPPV